MEDGVPLVERERFVAVPFDVCAEGGNVMPFLPSTRFDSFRTWLSLAVIPVGVMTGACVWEGVVQIKKEGRATTALRCVNKREGGSLKRRKAQRTGGGGEQREANGRRRGTTFQAERGRLFDAERQGGTYS